MPAIRARIDFLEERWKLLLEQPVVSMDEVDFTIASEPSSDSDSWHEYFSSDFDDGSLSDDPDRDYWKADM